INDTGLLTVDGTAAAVTANAGGRLKINTTGVTGDLTLNGGFASVDGKSGAAVINAGGVLGGIGLVHSLIARSGGTVSPGNSVGTLHVAGDATFDRGSVFDVEIATDRNRADRLDVGGNVMLLGGVVSVRLAGEKTGLSQAQIKDLFQKSYTILIADGTVSGTFENVLPHYTYITPSLLYAADKSMVSVGFDLTETARTEQAEKLTAAQAAAQAQADRLKAEGLAAEQAQAEADRLKAQLREEQIKNLVLMDAVTPNQKSTGHAVLQLGLGNRLLDTVLLHPQADAALNYDALSGEAHASLRGTLLQDAGLVSGAANERIRAAFDGVAARPVPVIIPLAYGPEDKAKNRQSADQAFDTTTPAPAAPATALWGQGYGAWSHGSSDGNASAYSRNTGGFVTG
ncbi:autotransporter outer membrane beta-barrel domain-containing protein, partial [Phyllobacterium myrsinacearum]